MQSKITLLGMYNYDNTIFDNLVFPAGIDKTLAINRILNKSEEFEVVYSDPAYLKDRIGIWGEIWERTFTKWVEALSIEYDPLYNYDRHEIYTDTKGREYKDSKTETSADTVNSSTANNSVSNSNSNSSTVTGSESGSVTEQKKSAYDEADYSDYQKEDAEAKTNQTGSGTSEANASTTDTSNTATGSVSQGASDAAGTSNEVTQHEAHLYGNIGVTTSVQMLKEQLDIVTWNLYEHISDIFIEEFCILVY